MVAVVHQLVVDNSSCQNRCQHIACFGSLWFGLVPLSPSALRPKRQFIMTALGDLRWEQAGGSDQQIKVVGYCVFVCLLDHESLLKVF